LVRRLIDERMVEVYNKLREDIDKRFMVLEENLAQRNIDERTVRTLINHQFNKLHTVVMEEISRVRSEIETLAKQGVDPELVRQMVEEGFNKLLDEVRQFINQRVMHLVDVINERSNEIRDILDLVSEVLKHEVAFEEEITKLRSELRRILDEEYLEELAYRALIKHGIIRKRRRRWGWVAVGLGILIAIVIGLLINPILTVVVLFIVFVILMRW